MSSIVKRKSPLKRPLAHALGPALLAGALVSMSPAALADHGGGHFGGGGHWSGGGHWGGGHWDGGHWGGRWGWGWGVGLGWWGWPYYGDWPYAYGAWPYYPPTYYEAPVAAAPAPLAPQSQSWYYCDSPKGYYPYVQSCDSPWRPVPATPPGSP